MNHGPDNLGGEQTSPFMPDSTETVIQGTATNMPSMPTPNAHAMASNTLPSMPGTLPAMGGGNPQDNAIAAMMAGQMGLDPSKLGDNLGSLPGKAAKGGRPEARVDPLLVSSPFGDYRLPSLETRIGTEESVHTFTKALAEELGKRAKPEAIEEKLTSILTGTAVKEAKGKDPAEKGKDKKDAKAQKSSQPDPDQNNPTTAKDAKATPVVDTRITDALPKIIAVIERVVSEPQSPFEAKSYKDLKGQLDKKFAENLVDALHAEAARDLELKNALDVVAEARGAGNPPDPEKVKEQIRQIAREVIATLTKDPLPTLEKEQTVKLGRGNIELKFVTPEDGTPATVEIINREANVKASFVPTNLEGVQREEYEKLLDSYGRHRPETAANRASDETKLIKIHSAKQLSAVYEQLVELSGANTWEEHLTFSVVDPSKDPNTDVRLLNEIGVYAAGQLNLAVEGADDRNAEQLVTALTEERHQIVQSGGAQSERKDQQELFTDSQSVTVRHHDTQTLRVRRELGEYFIDLTLPTSGGDLNVTIQLNQIADENLNYTIGKILERFSQEEKISSLAQSGVFKRLAGIGVISSIRGDKDNPAVIDDANMMGVMLAPKAVIEHVNFSKSALDFSGVETKISHCKFEQCHIAMLLRGAKIEDTTFDKKSVLFGDLSGQLINSKLQSNAYGLDAARLQVRMRDEKKVPQYDPDSGEPLEDYTRDARRGEVSAALGGAVFNNIRMPAGAYSLIKFMSSENVLKFNDDFEKIFIGTTFESYFHSYGVGGLFGNAASAAGQDGLNDVIVSKKHKINDQEVIDIYPSGVDPDDQRDDIDVMRIYLSGDEELRYSYGKKGALRSTFKLAKLASLKHGEGNFKTVQAALHFAHQHQSGSFHDAGRPVEIDDSVAPTP